MRRVAPFLAPVFYLVLAIFTLVCLAIIWPNIKDSGRIKGLACLTIFLFFGGFFTLRALEIARKIFTPNSCSASGSVSQSLLASQCSSPVRRRNYFLLRSAFLGALCGAAIGVLDGALRQLVVGDVGWKIFWLLDSWLHFVEKGPMAWGYYSKWHLEALALCCFGSA